ncbi:MAG TPA: dihydrofolate reductase [Erysipelothrix sp.]|nr:dihydrofolate reductase [Erysipelothrix sp.]
MITLIAAMNKTHTIGLDGKMPWHKPEDLKHFKNYTMGKTVLMGRKTFEGLPTKLKGRNILIVSKNPAYDNRIDDLVSYLKNDQETDELIIAGGGEIYRIAIDFADRIVLSLIEDNDVMGDTFFPNIDLEKFELINDEKKETFRLLTYQRKEE